MNTNTRIEIGFVRKAIQGLAANLSYAAIFGSSLTEESNSFSDIDLLVVCESGSDKNTIRKEMQLLSRNMGRTIHLNDYVSDEFEKRLRYHDYKLASILKDAVMMVDDGNHDWELNQLKGRIDEKSIRFNEIMGIENLFKASENLRKFKLLISHFKSLHETSFYYRFFQNLAIRYSHMALGYLYASQKMRQTGRIATLELLLEGTHLMTELIQAEDTIKKREYISAEKTEEYMNIVKSEFAKYRTDVARSIKLEEVY